MLKNDYWFFFLEEILKLENLMTKPLIQNNWNYLIISD